MYSFAVVSGRECLRCAGISFTGPIFCALIVRMHFMGSLTRKNGLVMVLRKMQQRTGQEFGYTERCVLFDDFRISRSNVDIL